MSKNKYPSQEWQNIKSTNRQRLISERKRRGWKQSQLAEMLSVSTSMISHLENGRLNPGLDVSMRLQELFGLPLEVLFPDL